MPHGNGQKMEGEKKTVPMALKNVSLVPHTNKTTQKQILKTGE